MNAVAGLLGEARQEARMTEMCELHAYIVSPSGWVRATGRVTAVAKVVVHVMPKAEILDPQGQAIVGALGRLGFDGISDVRQGKRFELVVDDGIADEKLAEIAESLLANTVIEDWSVSREAPEDRA